MRTYRDTAGQTWATVPVRAESKASAERQAKAAARREGLRVTDVGQATRQPESRVWHVHLGLRGECE